VIIHITAPLSSTTVISSNSPARSLALICSALVFSFQVELASSHVYSMSKSNETIYEANFEAGRVKEIYANYHGDPYSFSTEYSLEEKLGKEVMRLSKVRIRSVQDVYKALTDRDTFDKLSQQGLEKSIDITKIK
jgi:hypothetical protein